MMGIHLPWGKEGAFVTRQWHKAQGGPDDSKWHDQTVTDLTLNKIPGATPRSTIPTLSMYYGSHICSNPAVSGWYWGANKEGVTE
jgi:hypothetical protein